MYWVNALIWLGVAAAAEASVSLHLNWKPEAEFGGFYAALHQGAFKQEKIDVKVIPGGTGTPVVQMVAAGKADFGIASADEVIISQDRGTDVVGLFAVYQTNPQGLMARESAGFTKLPQVFEKGVLAVQSGLPYFMHLQKRYGPIKAKVVPYLGGITQLAENPQVVQQCFVTSEPILAQRKGFKVKTFLVAESGFNPYTAVLIAKKSYIKNESETVSAMLRAVSSGWKMYLKDPKPANEVMHRLNPSMDLDTLEKSARIQVPLIQVGSTAVGSMAVQRWDELAGQLQALGLVKAVKPGQEYFVP